MSVKVNLLPQEVGERSRAGRQKVVTGLAFGVLLAGVAGAWFWNGGRVDDARSELADAEADVALLQGELGELAPFAELADRRADRQGIVTTTLGDEVSVAGVLQDLSSVFPPNAELDQLSVAITGEGSPVPGGERLVVGSVSASGRLLLGVAPGAERLLIDVGRAAAFDNPIITTSSSPDGSTSFQFDFELGPESMSGRYVDESTAAPAATSEVAP